MGDQGFLKCLQDLFPCLELESDEVVLFLRKVGLMNPGGSFYNEREKKSYEIAHFAGHVVKAVSRVSVKREVTLLDCGCGRSYLSFFLASVFKKLRRDVKLIGVDSNAELVETCRDVKDRLGFHNIEFFQSEIADFDPKEKVSIVCALHACDTATDAAIALGVNLEARYIMVAPCCQRQVVRQVGRVSKNVPQVKPLVSTKIAREYVGVALTETLRKLALESFGYKVDMFEFISSRYTPKNILLRAEKMRTWNDESFETYKGLRDYFNVEPKIEEYLPDIS